MDFSCRVGVLEDGRLDLYSSDHTPEADAGMVYLALVREPYGKAALAWLESLPYTLTLPGADVVVDFALRREEAGCETCKHSEFEQHPDCVGRL